jgi:hypothetical protein
MASGSFNAFETVLRMVAMRPAPLLRLENPCL